MQTETDSLVRIYNRLDNLVLNSVESGVRAGNWIFGATKTQIAKGLIYTTPFLTFISEYNRGDNIRAFGSAAIYLFACYRASRFADASKEKEMRERALGVDSRSDDYGLVGNLALLMGAVNYFSAFLPQADKPGVIFKSQSVSSLIDALWLTAAGLAVHSLRVESIQSRSNCLRRGIESF